MPPVSVMVKPASGNCNLRCAYCFYRDVAESRDCPSRGMMSADLMRELLGKIFRFADGHPVTLNFQGGEPLLRGKDFFRGVIRDIDRLNAMHSPVFLGIQTNGTLIDDEWCKIFKDGNFLVGLSLDGDRSATKNRVFPSGAEAFANILDGAEKLKENGVNFNILTVLTRDVANRIEDIYTFFTQRGFKNLQFIPCLKPLDGRVTNEDDYLDAASYAHFLIAGFNLYRNDILRGKYTSVRNFDNFVRLAHRLPAEQCGMNGHCTHQFAIEADGSTYPCDFYCTDEWLLGNIRDCELKDLERTERAVRFITESLVIPEKCKACAYYALCRGGCKRERKDIDKCDAYKAFFRYALNDLKRIF